jgi:hypothetical protein
MCKAARQLLNTAKQQRKASPTMTSHLAEAGRTLIPRKDDRYGLLSQLWLFSRLSPDWWMR